MGRGVVGCGDVHTLFCKKWTRPPNTFIPQIHVTHYNICYLVLTYLLKPIVAHVYDDHSKDFISNHRIFLMMLHCSPSCLKYLSSLCMLCRRRRVLLVLRSIGVRPKSRQQWTPCPPSRSRWTAMWSTWWTLSPILEAWLTEMD